jgi:conjugal transfer mating pair stabilization protein TraN
MMTSKETISSWLILILFFIAGSQSIAQTHSSGSCSYVPNSKTCVDSAPCKTSPTGESVCLSSATTIPTGALRVPQTCWQYSHTFACTKPNTVNTCGEFESDDACSLVNSKCTDTRAGSSECIEYQKTYSCKTANATTSTQTVCSDGTITPLVLPTPPNNNDTFQRAAIAQEIASQAQKYAENGQNAFIGVGESCTVGYFGMKNCCKSASGAKSNSVVANLAMGAAGGIAKYAGEVAIDAASPYMFDLMYAGMKSWTSGFVADAMGPISGTDLSSGGLSLGAYGFTYSTVQATAGSGLMGATTTIGGSASTGYISFNPYVFAAYIAFAYIQELMACTNEEQMLAMHKGANLTYQTGEYCSNEIPLIGTCIEHTRTFCSFNSVLSKIINIQGKPQLNKNVRDCSGISFDDLSKLDFGKIDFSEFTSSMVNQATKNQPKNISKTYKPIMEKSTQGSGQSANQGSAYSNVKP